MFPGTESQDQLHYMGKLFLQIKVVSVYIAVHCCSLLANHCIILHISVCIVYITLNGPGL